jgi:hypothetical protein
MLRCVFESRILLRAENPVKMKCPQVSIHRAGYQNDLTAVHIEIFKATQEHVSDAQETNYGLCGTPHH